MTVDRVRLHDLRAREETTFVELHPCSAALAADAARHFVGGVPMAWMTRWPGAHPVFVDRADGARVVDVDGHELVDFCLGDTGAMAGHGLDEVAVAAAERVQYGATTMLPTADTAWVGSELTRRFGVPHWQMAMTATDANRFVLRFARHVTARPKILVFDWCYHGTVDETLATLDATGRVVARHGVVGPSFDVAATTKVVPFNDADALRDALAPGDVACVLAEPALTNIGIVLPEPGFHDALRDACDRTGTLLVLDETHTICAGAGGATRAWELRPDALVIGKAIGGGVPAAAYGFSTAFAERVAPLLADPTIDVSGVGGTLTGSALALAAVRATLSTTLRDDDFARAIPLARRWTDGVASVIADAGLPWHVQRLGTRAEYWFCPPPRTGAEAAAAVDGELDAFLHLYALNRGILLTPFHNMALLSPFHTAADVDLHTEVFATAVAELTE